MISSPEDKSNSLPTNRHVHEGRNTHHLYGRLCRLPPALSESPAKPSLPRWIGGRPSHVCELELKKTDGRLRLNVWTPNCLSFSRRGLSPLSWLVVTSSLPRSPIGRGRPRCVGAVIQDNCSYLVEIYDAENDIYSSLIICGFRVSKHYPTKDTRNKSRIYILEIRDC